MLTHAHLGPDCLGLIWYHSKPSDIPLCIKQTSFLVWTYFAVSYSKTALGIELTVSEILSCIYGEGFSTMLQYRVSDLTSREQKADCNECIL